MMPAGNSPQVAAKDADALIFARIWGGLIAVCDLGGLAGAVVPLFFHSTNTPGSRLAVMFLSLAHHIIALITAIMLLIGLRSARFGLLLTIALTIARCVFILSLSVVVALVLFGFGLLLYVPPLVLIYWRPKQFR
jgi:hypothetical protein